MNFEENRLESFYNWPHDAAIQPPRIARAGFYATHEGLKVRCFACSVEISDWSYGDQVMARHRALNPTCPFVTSPSTSGNVPIINNSSTPPSSSSDDDYREESARLATFVNWPVSHIITPQRLAKAGFYYLKVGDMAKCAFCKGVVVSWEIGDDPDLEHRRFFPNCPYVVTEIIPRIEPTNGGDTAIDPAFVNLNLVANEDLHQLGVQAHKGPKRPAYGTLEARLRSFVSWPPDLIQTPDVLAHAGFYYEGMGDQVRCFHCDGGLRHWDPQDDPWTEHARWFPKCSFIKLVKGQKFISACSSDVNVTSNLEEVDQKQTDGGRSRRRKVTENELQEQMRSEAAISALRIGLNVERVKRALREKLEQTGRGFSQPDALVEAALNLQHDEGDGEDDDDDDDEEEEDEENGDDNNISIEGGRQCAAVENLERLMRRCISNEETSSTTKSDRKDDRRADETKNDKKVSLEEENRILKEARLCKICMDVEVGIVFLPCGHLATCVNCAPNLEDCPVCRSKIKATVRTFLS